MPHDRDRRPARTLVLLALAIAIAASWAAWRVALAPRGLDRDRSEHGGSTDDARHSARAPSEVARLGEGSSAATDAAIERAGLAPRGGGGGAPADRDRTATADAARAMVLARAVPAASPVSDERAEPTVDNTCPVDVELFWVDHEGRERSYGALEAGVWRPLPSYRGHVWRVRDLDGAMLRAFVVEPRADIAICDDAHAPSATATVTRARPSRTDALGSARSVEPAFLTIENTCDEPIALAWVHFDGTERPYGRVPPGAARTQRTFAGHRWHLRSVDDGALIRTVTAIGDLRIAPCGGSLAPDAT
jgi:hypothetical protein